jgi:DNA-binding transcriptional regulator LsrR (DeoR family)
LSDLRIVSMIGGVSVGESFNTFSVASGFAEKLGASYSLFAAPVYLSIGTDREAFLSEPGLRAQMERCGQLELAILAASDLSSKSFLMRDGLPSDVTADALFGLGAVGDVLGRFLDANGGLIDHSINDRVVGMEFAQLKDINEVVLAAAGAHKIDIILAAIRHGFVTTLITDDLTAELLLGQLE